MPDQPVGGGGPRPIPDRASWYAEPARMFDNLYWVGTKIHSAWALQTSDGIILIDTLYNYAVVEPEIVEGSRNWACQSRVTIKYVIITHAHGDHDEGARLLQERYGAHVVMGAPDWDLIEKNPNIPGGVPKRDIGRAPMARRLQPWAIQPCDPYHHARSHIGHLLSVIFPVKDHGKPVTLTVVALFRRHRLFNFPKDVARITTPISRPRNRRWPQPRKAAPGATIMMSNHSRNSTMPGNAVALPRLVRLRRAGEPHPYDIGADAVQRYFHHDGQNAPMAMRTKLAAALAAS